MQMLYEEMESSLASIYEIVGYFDIEPNNSFQPNVLILVILTILLILCPKNSYKTRVLFIVNGAGAL